MTLQSPIHHSNLKYPQTAAISPYLEGKKLQFQQPVILTSKDLNKEKELSSLSMNRIRDRKTLAAKNQQSGHKIQSDKEKRQPLNKSSTRIKQEQQQQLKQEQQKLQQQEQLTIIQDQSESKLDDQDSMKNQYGSTTRNSVGYSGAAKTNNENSLSRIQLQHSNTIFGRESNEDSMHQDQDYQLGNTLRACKTKGIFDIPQDSIAEKRMSSCYGMSLTKQISMIDDILPLQDVLTAKNELRRKDRSESRSRRLNNFNAGDKLQFLKECANIQDLVRTSVKNLQKIISDVGGENQSENGIGNGSIQNFVRRTSYSPSKTQIVQSKEEINYQDQSIKIQQLKDKVGFFLKNLFLRRRLFKKLKLLSNFRMKLFAVYKGWIIRQRVFKSFLMKQLVKDIRNLRSIEQYEAAREKIAILIDKINEQLITKRFSRKMRNSESAASLFGKRMVSSQLQQQQNSGIQSSVYQSSAENQDQIPIVKLSEIQQFDMVQSDKCAQQYEISLVSTIHNNHIDHQSQSNMALQQYQNLQLNNYNDFGNSVEIYKREYILSSHNRSQEASFVIDEVDEEANYQDTSQDEDRTSISNGVKNNSKINSMQFIMNNQDTTPAADNKKSNIQKGYNKPTQQSQNKSSSLNQTKYLQRKDSYAIKTPVYNDSSKNQSSERQIMQQTRRMMTPKQDIKRTSNVNTPQQRQNLNNPRSSVTITKNNRQSLNSKLTESSKKIMTAICDSKEQSQYLNCDLDFNDTQEFKSKDDNSSLTRLKRPLSKIDCWRRDTSKISLNDQQQAQAQSLYHPVNMSKSPTSLTINMSDIKHIVSNNETQDLSPKLNYLDLESYDAVLGKMKNIFNNLKNKKDNDDMQMNMTSQLSQRKDYKIQLEKCIIDLRREFDLLCLEKFGQCD